MLWYKIIFYLKASKIGDLNTVKYLIEKGADINKANDFGHTPLIWGNWDIKENYYLFNIKSILFKSKW